MKAQINWTEKTVSFSGEGTFEAKEEIKRLGRARWNPALKQWVVVFEALSLDLLNSRFPALVIEESGVAAEVEAPAVPSAEPALAKKSASKAQKGSRRDLIKQSFSVVEFIERVRASLYAAFPQRLLIRGRLSALKRSGDRVFLTLSDEERTEVHLDCIIWENEETVCAELKKAGFELEIDLPLLFVTLIGINPKDGRLSLSVVGVIAEYTVGKLAAEREKTNERLRKEGLFERNRKLKLSLLPRRLGVLTSAGGTVINDFLASLEEAQFAFEVFWLPVTVQGDAAKKEIVAGLQQLARTPGLDAILLFRGGGSAAELALFNDYAIAREICRSPRPVLSAIGHETDQSSAQDVSYRSFGVPKDVGRFFADLLRELRQHFSDDIRIIHNALLRQGEQAQQGLGNIIRSLGQLLTYFVEQQRELIQRFVRSLPLLGAMELNRIWQRLRDLSEPLPALSRRVIEISGERLLRAGARMDDLGLAQQSMAKNHLEQIAKRLSLLGQGKVRESQLRLESLQQLISSQEPRVQLERGFTLVKHKKHQSYVLDGAKLKAGEEVEIEFRDMVKGAKIS